MRSTGSQRSLGRSRSTPEHRLATSDRPVDAIDKVDLVHRWSVEEAIDRLAPRNSDLVNGAKKRTGGRPGALGTSAPPAAAHPPRAIALADAGVRPEVGRSAVCVRVCVARPPRCERRPPREDLDARGGCITPSDEKQRSHRHLGRDSRALVALITQKERRAG